MSDWSCEFLGLVFNKTEGVMVWTWLMWGESNESYCVLDNFRVQIINL